MSNKLNGLDLFSGIGGLSVGLSEWVKPVAYCEIDRYAAAVLFSRMSDGNLPAAPIFPDVRSLSKEILPSIDIIYGGFPCQDISVAGHGKGLAGERSGLFFEIVRLAKEIQPTFLFLENVPAITGRGLDTIIREITKAGYDVRWTTLSAQEIGAPHKRERWWLLGHSKHNGSLTTKKRGSIEETVFNDSERSNKTSEFTGASASRVLAAEVISDSKSDGQRSREESRGNVERLKLMESTKSGVDSEHLCKIISDTRCESKGAIENLQSESEESIGENTSKLCCNVSDTDLLRKQQPQGSEQEQRQWASDGSWWLTEPDVGRVANGVLNRVDRIKCLGNAVVPLQAREAFKELMGINHDQDRPAGCDRLGRESIRLLV
jgi:DNA (cytosine-5)-methyltransferase 1